VDRSLYLRSSSWVSSIFGRGGKHASSSTSGRLSPVRVFGSSTPFTIPFACPEYPSWEVYPNKTLELLELIRSNERYRQAFFSLSLSQPKNQYQVAREICLEFFADDPWMMDAKRRGLVKRQAGTGKWVETENWTSRVTNPVKGRIAA
jgi:hypothetical protein